MYLSEIKMKEIQKKEGNNNWIFVYDRSGSMSGVLKQLGDDLIRLSNLLKENDTISLAYFSGENQFRFILKGFLITKEKNVTPIENIIKQNLSSIGLTCFSEVLDESYTVINDLKLAFPTNSFVLCFLTDGVPYPGGKKEEERIFKALSNLKNVVGDGLMVGYGDFYGKELMVKMANEIGGSFVHADEISDFSKNVEVIIKTGKTSNKIEIDVNDKDVILVFGKSDGQIKIYPYSNGKAIVSDTEKEVFAITKEIPTKNNETIDNLYAGAYSLALSGNVQESLEWLGKIGDKYLVDKLNNAFTNAEIGDAINSIKDATFDESKRMVDGYRKNYVAKKDAFCVLDAIEFLIQDDKAFFYPNHSQWEYKKIGVSSKVKNGFSKFYKDINCKCRFSDIVMNKSRLNLSVRTTVSGYIELDDDHDKFKFEKQFKTYKWKNYSIISDGNLNVRKIPSSMSENTFDILQKGGLIKKTEKWVENEIYVLDLKRIPIMNRMIGESFKSASNIAELSLCENETKAIIKTLKYLKDKKSPKEEFKKTSFTSNYFHEQIEYLYKNGIKEDGSYNPDSEKEDTTDFYLAKTFEIKVSGFSSIPKIEDVIKKKESGKKLNYCDSIISDNLTIFENDSVEKIDSAIKDFNNIVKKVNSQIQKAKFSVILGKNKFKEFDGNEGEVTLKDNIKVKFVFGEEKVKF